MKRRSDIRQSLSSVAMGTGAEGLACWRCVELEGLGLGWTERSNLRLVLVLVLIVSPDQRPTPSLNQNDDRLF